MTDTPSPWIFTPSGAAVHRGENVAVVADVHLGYEWARGAGGDQVPAHSLRETIEALEGLLGREPIQRLIVAGDLVETPRPCPRTARDVASLENWLRGRGVELIALQGNHDPPRRPPRPETIDVGDWRIGHGHRPIDGLKTMFGHYHPTFRAFGVNTRCFLVGPDTIALPAFSPNAAGLNVAAANVPGPFRGRELRCVVATGESILDFGRVEDLAARLGRSDAL